jgi:hypothetical protein
MESRDTLRLSFLRTSLAMVVAAIAPTGPTEREGRHIVGVE